MTVRSLTMQTISYEQVGAVGWLRLNRPDRLNAMTIEMWDELAKLGDSLGDDASLRCLVVMGEGRAFSSGIDLEHLLAGGGSNLFSEAGKGSPPLADSPTSGLGMEDKLAKTFDVPATDPATGGMVCASQERRAVGFGFCDCVYLTGSILFPSLLRWRRVRPAAASLTVWPSSFGLSRSHA